MLSNRTRQILISALAAMAFLGGCALSPQDVVIAPQVTLSAQNVALRGPIAVTVYDRRSTPWIGDRGGVYRNNQIGVANSLEEGVQEAVERVLVSAGMEPGDFPEAPQFEVFINQLNYKVPDTSYITRVALSASVRIVIRAGDKVYQGNYGAKENRRVLKAPSETDNQAMINDILANAIGQAFQDPRLMRYLARL